MKRPLIIGGNSKIACALNAELDRLDVSPAVTMRRRDQGGIFLDLSVPPDAWPRLPETDVAFLCAAASKLDFCEDHPEESHRINVAHMQILAERLQAQGCFVIFLSTNQVFDGSRPWRHAGEPACPLNEYGRQKAAFEQWLSMQSCDSAVLRLTKVMTGSMPTLGEWAQRLSAGETVHAFDDLRFAPLPAACVVEALLRLARERKGGIYQLSGSQDLSYYDLALALAASLGEDETRIRPCSAADAGIRPQFLPRHTTLEGMAAIRVPDSLDCFYRALRTAGTLLNRKANS